MKSTPIIPGKLYRVRGNGLDVTVIARNPCDAISALLSKVLP